MSFIASVFTAVIDVVVGIVEAVVQVVELVVQLIMVVLGYDGGSTQIVEYFEVRNYPLFEDVDRRNPIKSSIMQSVIGNRDVGSNLIYHLVFRSLKANIQEFTSFIDQGNYFENFPDLDSYILVVDYDELTAALQTLTGVACTVETAYLRALSKSDWVKYWLQENRNYNPTSHALGDISNVVVNAVANSSNTTVNQVLTDWDIQISDSFNFAEDATADARWFVDLDNITYNTSTDDYTLNLYTGALTRTLANEVPTKPVGSHVYSFYYLDSNPTQTKVFIYKLGTGTYTNLDDIEPNQSISSSVLKTLPAVPLRVNNVNYTGGIYFAL